MIPDRVHAIYEVYCDAFAELATADDWRLRDIPFLVLILGIATVGLLVAGRPHEEYPRPVSVGGQQ